MLLSVRIGIANHKTELTISLRFPMGRDCCYLPELTQSDLIHCLGTWDMQISVAETFQTAVFMLNQKYCKCYQCEIVYARVFFFVPQDMFCSKHVVYKPNDSEKSLNISYSQDFQKHSHSNYRSTGLAVCVDSSLMMIHFPGLPPPKSTHSEAALHLPFPAFSGPCL